MNEIVITDLEGMEGWLRPLLRDVSRGDRVFIKPNLCNDMPPSSGVTTDLRIVAAVVRALRESGVEEICVGESSIYGTEENLKRLGFYGLARLGAEPLNLDAGEWVAIEGGLEAPERFHLPRKLIEADVVISVPKMKTHMEAGVTLGLKNFFGVLSRGDRKLAHMGDIHEVILSVYRYLRQRKRIYTVVDALVALEGRNGPTAGSPVHMGLIIMGSDPVAVDAACVRVMGADPQDIPHLRRALREGLSDAAEVKTIGKAIDEVKRDFVFPDLREKRRRGITGKAAGMLFRNYPLMADRGRCTLCMGCVNICPTGSVSLSNGSIAFDYRNCISCLCCCEVCKARALDYRMEHEALYEGIKMIKKLIRGKS